MLQPYFLHREMDVIEAGCGRSWPEEFYSPLLSIIGIDSDEVALQLRTDLKQAIAGDVCKVDIPGESADLVYSSFVLEHVRGAQRALENFVKWTRPGGLIIIRVPDRNSVYGVVTRFTPLWVHVAYKRFIENYYRAGEPGYGPYPTYHEKICSRSGLNEFCASNGCEVVEDRLVNLYLSLSKFRRLKKSIAMAVWLGSLGRFSWRHDNICFIIRKLPAVASTV